MVKICINPTNERHVRSYTHWQILKMILPIRYDYPTFVLKLSRTELFYNSHFARESPSFDNDLTFKIQIDVFARLSALKTIPFLLDFLFFAVAVYYVCF